MRHYHCTPLNGTREDVARFLQARHALIPFPHPEDAPIAFEVCRSVAFEHGMNNVDKSDRNRDVDGYIRWCEEWHRHPGFDWALIPDAIEGGEAENDALLRDWPRDIAGVPVYHLHEDPKRLVRLAADYPIVALGSSSRAWSRAGTAGWWSRMATIMDAICDEEGRPICKLHGLRMMEPDIFTALPLASADSTCAVQVRQATERSGVYLLPDQVQRTTVIAERIEAHNSAPIWQRPRQQLLYSGPQKLAL